MRQGHRTQIQENKVWVWEERRLWWWRIEQGAGCCQKEGVALMSQPRSLPSDRRSYSTHTPLGTAQPSQIPHHRFVMPPEMLIYQTSIWRLVRASQFPELRPFHGNQDFLRGWFLEKAASIWGWKLVSTSQIAAQGGSAPHSQRCITGDLPRLNKCSYEPRYSHPGTNLGIAFSNPAPHCWAPGFHICRGREKGSRLASILVLSLFCPKNVSVADIFPR